MSVERDIMKQLREANARFIIDNMELREKIRFLEDKILYLEKELERFYGD